MKIYNFDKDTLEFLSVSDAQKNPKRENEYLIPKYSTTVLPPKLNANEQALFIDGFWKIVPDYRGKKVINPVNNEIFVIKELGNIPDGVMFYDDYLKSDMYKEYLQKVENENVISGILDELKVLDEKRIRAVCEPEVKDATTGETWLEFYNSQIAVLRQRLLEVNYDN